MSLAKIMKLKFEGCSEDRLKSLMKKLENLGITTKDDLRYLEEEDLREQDIVKNEIKKLMLLKPAETDDTLKVVVREIFKGEPANKIEKCLNLLNEMSVYKGDDLSLVLDKIEESLDFSDTDKKKIKRYMNLEIERDKLTLNYALEKLFKGENAEKINKYLSIFNKLGIYFENHLPLGLSDISKHPDILEIDKSKIKQYVKEKYTDDFKDFHEIDKHERELRITQREKLNVMECTKLDHRNDEVEVMKQERRHLSDETTRLRKIITDYQNKHPVANFLAGTETRIKNLEKTLKENEQLKLELDKKIEEKLGNLNASTLC